MLLKMKMKFYCEEWLGMKQKPPPPAGVSVGFRTGVIDLEELEGFARSFNTIHGLILHLRSILDDIEG